ncbi:MAG: tRNA (guanosine(46)-N7)-methyltransferase TrmB [Bacilli bacterium]|nr:tRNA (guanosine(46)-N7)-methyltransferase TrmB [Bacilli bacterium]
MRLRNIKNKEEIISSSEYIVKDYMDYIGKWNTLFNNDNPIYLEIGMGMGKFITENAINNPNINYIGVEKQDNVLARALPNIPKDIPNLKVIRLNALDIDKVFSKEISLLYLNFSDPWPKVRHHSRRLTSTIFLNKYESIFKDKKVIELRTDNENLYIYSLETLSSNGYKLQDITFDLNNSLPERITTEYEDKFINKGNKIYYVNASK